MTITQFRMSTIIFASFLLVAGLPALSTLAADQSSSGTMPSAYEEARGAMAAGAVEDSLKACLARIPQDASTGQRMIAEQSCEQDQETRQLVQDAPKF